MWKRRAYSMVQQHEIWQILLLLFFLIPVGAGGLFSPNRLLYYFESLFTASCRGFLKISVLKTLDTIHRKPTVSKSLFNQPAACYFFNKRLRHRRFIADSAKLSRTPFLQITLGFLHLYLLKISVILPNLVLPGQSGISNQLRHS